MINFKTYTLRLCYTKTMNIFGKKIQEVPFVLLLSFIYMILIFTTNISPFGFITSFLPLIIFLWIYISHKIAQSAARKNRNYQSFFFLSLLVSPILMGIIVAVIPEPNK
jgi:amino acid permease